MPEQGGDVELLHGGAAKQLELLAVVVPGLSPVGLLNNPNTSVLQAGHPE